MSSSPRPDFAQAAIRGTAWRYATFFSGKLMVFISTVVLARLLTKDDFGVVGYAVTAISFLDVVSDLGISPAVIYHQEDEKTSSTAFWLAQIIAWGLFLLTWIFAPFIGAYFRDERAVDVVRVLALTYPLDALGSIHNSVLRKRLAFNRIFVSDLAQSIGKGVISIALAFWGFGPWGLIWGQLGGVALGSLALWFVSPWRPNISFSTDMTKSLLSYGVKVVSVDSLGIVLMNVDYLLVGRYLGAAALGVYTLAFRMPDLLILQFARILSTVIFPIYTKMRDLPGGMSKGFAQTTRFNALIAVPLGLGLALVAEPFVLTFFTDKWGEIIPIVRAISLYSLFLSLAYNAGSAYKAQGRPQVLTWLNLARLVVLLPALWWATTVEKSLIAVGWMHALVAFLGGALNLYMASRLLELSAMELFEALRPAIIAGGIMAGAVLLSLFVMAQLPAWATLSVATIIGGLAYIVGLWFVENSLVLEIISRTKSTLGWR
jgi:PST family polysaccharide transporter